MRFDNKDIEVSELLDEAIVAQRQSLGAVDFNERTIPNRAATRRALLNPNDDLAVERILGHRDLMGINFLTRGAEAARPVCRIRVRDRHQNPHSMGSGFLVAPGLLITNNHVIGSPEAAEASLAEFDVELDENFVAKPIRSFQLRPDLLFFTDVVFDFTFVAVSTFSHQDIPLSDFGTLPLLSQSGKAIPGESVTIIQHPRGGLKQIVIRASQIVELKEHTSGIGHAFIHYTSDTEPGSSGAPVMNDQWDVVAIHHKAVPRFKNGKIQTRDGDDWHESMGTDQIDWLANEGVRISQIYGSLRRHASRDENAKTILHTLNCDPIRCARTGSSMVRHRRTEEQIPDALPFETTSFDGVDGYDSDFLGTAIPLPKVVDPWAADVVKLKDGGNVLKYRHFSVVMSVSRRLAYLVAVNIEGSTLLKPTKKPSWRRDDRIERSHQIENVLYKAAEGEDFDIQRGHLVRRLDPAWGDQETVNEAVSHTYHYTNAAPQGADFNDDVWGDLEDFILKRAFDSNHRVTVFAGPIFDDETDPFYRHDFDGGPFQIPMAYWKVAAFRKPDGTLSATAYKQEQPEVRGFVEAGNALSESFTRGFRPMNAERREAVQLKIADLEELTLIDFGKLKEFDPLGKVESTKAERRIVGVEDLVL